MFTVNGWIGVTFWSVSPSAFWSVVDLEVGGDDEESVALWGTIDEWVSDALFASDGRKDWLISV